MRLITFDPFRAIGIPNVTYIKPELIFRERALIQEADWVLFPEYWQVNFLHYGWKKRIFPSISTYHLGHDKVEMTRALQAIMPEYIPYTIISANTPLAKEQILEELGFPFVAKEIRNSMGRGVHLIENMDQFNEYLKNNEIVYAQEYLPIERDLRIVYVGNRVISAYWRTGEGFKNNVAQGGRIEFDSVPREAIDVVEHAAILLGINHAGFDVAIVGGHIYFFEFNVMFGNQALHLADVPLTKYILDYIASIDQPEPPKPVLPTTRVS